MSATLRGSFSAWVLVRACLLVDLLWFRTYVRSKGPDVCSLLAHASEVTVKYPTMHFSLASDSSNSARMSVIQSTDRKSSKSVRSLYHAPHRFQRRKAFWKVLNVGSTSCTYPPLDFHQRKTCILKQKEILKRAGSAALVHRVSEHVTPFLAVELQNSPRTDGKPLAEQNMERRSETDCRAGSILSPLTLDP